MTLPRSRQWKSGLPFPTESSFKDFWDLPIFHLWLHLSGFTTDKTNLCESPLCVVAGSRDCFSEIKCVSSPLLLCYLTLTLQLSSWWRWSPWILGWGRSFPSAPPQTRSCIPVHFLMSSHSGGEELWSKHSPSLKYNFDNFTWWYISTHDI